MGRKGRMSTVSPDTVPGRHVLEERREGEEEGFGPGKGGRRSSRKPPPPMVSGKTTRGVFPQ